VVVYEEIYEFFSIIIKWPFSGWSEQVLNMLKCRGKTKCIPRCYFIVRI
jgi:hypothetical protein